MYFLLDVFYNYLKTNFCKLKLNNLIAKLFFNIIIKLIYIIIKLKN